MELSDGSTKTMNENQQRNRSRRRREFFPLWVRPVEGADFRIRKFSGWDSVGFDSGVLLKQAWVGVYGIYMARVSDIWSRST